jgi:hypothetical protein
LRRRLPLVLGIAAALATLLLVGPVAVAVALLRSSSDSHGPTLGARLLIAAFVAALVAAAGFVVWGLTRLVLRLLDRGAR